MKQNNYSSFMSKTSLFRCVLFMVALLGLSVFPLSSMAQTTRPNIEPMIKASFGCGTPYNNRMPEVEGAMLSTKYKLTLNAVAMAEVMHYYQWPQQTTDVIPAAESGIYLPEIPITTIDWGNILPHYDYQQKNYTQKNEDAVVNLMMICETSVQTFHFLNDDRIWAFYEYFEKVATALRNYLGYDEQVELVEQYYYSPEVWEQMIYDELKNGRPVIYYAENNDDYGLALESIIVDGYKDGLFHIICHNIQYEGYVNLLNIEIPEHGTFSKHKAIIGIQPDLPDNPKQYMVVDNGKMTFCYDKERESRTGNVTRFIDDHSNYAEEVTEVEFDRSFADAKPKDLSFLFYGYKNLKKIVGIENLNTSLTWDMTSMFSGCSSLESLDVSGFKTDFVSEFAGMFYDCSSLTSLDVSGFKTDRARMMSSMFAGCTGLTSLDVSGFRTDNVKSIDAMFYGCSGLTSLDLSGFKTDNVTSMAYMFYGCSGLTSLDVSGFKTNNVTDMAYMFYGCSGLTSLDVSGFRTDNVTDMRSMFADCENLTSLDVSGFKTDNVTDMRYMFAFCKITSLNLGGFNTVKVKDMYSMFRNCYELSTIYVGEGWDTSNVENADEMFMDCKKIVGGAGTAYDKNHIGKDYAHMDEAPDNPGYFTSASTGIITPLLDHPVSHQVYNLQGKRLNSLQKGVNIIRTNKGQAKKLLVK